MTDPRTAQMLQRNRIEVLPSDNPPWEDENGRLWQTEQGQPIPTGYIEPVRTEMAGQLTDCYKIATFCLAGNATLTLVSKKTGKRYTYKVRKPDDFQASRPIWFVSVLKGSDNEADFGYIGQIRTTRYLYERGKKCWKDWYAASAAFQWFWDHIQQHELPKMLEVWHEGRCGRCNRKLTVPESVASGFGPECINHV